MILLPNGSKQLINLKHGGSLLRGGDCARTRDFQELHQLTVIVLPYQRLVDRVLENSIVG